MGAAHLAPANTLEAFDAALAAGVDMIEFDVLSERVDGMGPLFLAHDYEALRASARVPLELALQHLSGPEFGDVEFDVDLKLPGYGLRVISALMDAGLLHRTLLSTTFHEELRTIRAQSPGVRLGWSVPRVRRDYTKHALTFLPAVALLQVARRALPRRAAAAIGTGRVDAIMAHWRLVTPALLRAVRGSCGQLYVWTVDEPSIIEKLLSMSVDGIITNDPRLFRASQPTVA